MSNIEFILVVIIIINSLMSTVYLFSSDIGMRINVDKSAKPIVSCGRIVTSVDFELNSLEAIKDA